MGFLEKASEVFGELNKKVGEVDSEFKKSKEIHSKRCRRLSDEKLIMEYRRFSGSNMIERKAKKDACKEELESRGLL